MAIKYRLEQLHDNIGQEAKQGSFPVIVKGKTITLDMLADMITLRSSFSRGDVVGMMACLSDILPDLLLLGSNVNIDGLGTFGITATLKEGVDPSDKISGKDIRVKRVTFRQSPEIMTRLEDAAFVRDK